MNIPQTRFTDADVTAANELWPFNCGPAALCAVLEMRPEELRPYMLDFESKGYTNPTLMLHVLQELRIPYKVTYRGDEPPATDAGQFAAWPMFGLARIQWGGRWTNPGVPMRARYRQTHWVGVAQPHGDDPVIFDVNALELSPATGGWLPLSHWSGIMVPEILKACVPGADGYWWVTHGILIPPSH